MSQAEIVSHGREYRYRQQRPHVGNPTHHVQEKLQVARAAIAESSRG